MWTNMRTVSRTLGQLVCCRADSCWQQLRLAGGVAYDLMAPSQIWFHVPDERKDDKGKELPAVQIIMEKRTMIKLVRPLCIHLHVQVLNAMLDTRLRRLCQGTVRIV
jgi:hypothetical protein